MSNTSTPPDFASDRPIEHIHQDKLGRRAFARKTAAAIARRHNRESFVVALQGAWGCGKSSIKNMVLEALKENSPTPIVVEFVPWQLRDADTLFSVFFEEIALAIGKAGDQNEERKNKLSSYGKHLTLGGSTIKALGTLGGVIGVPGAKIVELLGEGLGSAAKVALEGGEVIGKQSLKDLKEELRESLRGLDRSVLVVIDDIDRLEIEEMLLIFQLVKANADFPNFTYLLLLQREAVESALESKMGEQSHDYLDKIIQLPIDIPPISPGQRRQLLHEGIIEICDSWNLPLSSAQTSELDLVWNSGLKEMLQYPRDVRRLLNALEFSGALMQGEAGLEINLADFTALESLRIQEPKAYARLPTLKSLLTGPKPSSDKDIARRYNIPNANIPEVKEEEQPGQRDMQRLIDLFSEGRRDAGRKVLAFLFPQANWALLTSEEARNHVPLSRRETGIYVKESRYFSRYFDLSIPDDQVSEAEIARVLSSTGDVIAFCAHLKEFEDKRLLWLLLVELKDRAKEIPETDSISVLTALLDFGEEIPEQIGFLGDPMELSAGWLVGEILKKKGTTTERGELFSQAVTASKALRFPVRWIWDEEVANQNRNPLPRLDGWATDEQLQTLRTLVNERIEGAASQNELEKHPKLQMIVRFWAETQKAKVVEWLAQKMVDDAGLRFFLSNFSHKSYIVDRNPTLADITFEQDVLGWVTDLAAVKERVAALNQTGWEELDKVTAKKFVGFADYLLTRTAGLDSNQQDNPEEDLSI